jgi:hypothetical protein
VKKNNQTCQKEKKAQKRINFTVNWQNEKEEEKL